MAMKVDFERELGGVAVGARRASEAAPRSAAGGVRVKTIALPTEHGGWGITLEPVLLGLLVAPSWAGAGLALATLGAFLARHPFKIVAGDRRRGRRFPRTPVAERFTLLYCAVALAGFVLALAAARGYEFLLPLALAAPLAAAQLWYDAVGRSRGLLPELAGSVAMGSVAAALALAGGAGWTPALCLWVVLAARFVPAILYVRARLTELHGKEFSRWPSLLAHAAALGAVSALAAYGLLPRLAVLAAAVLLGRAAYGFARRWPATARHVGFSEIAFGALTVAAVAAGVAFGI